MHFYKILLPLVLVVLVGALSLLTSSCSGNTTSRISELANPKDAKKLEPPILKTTTLCTSNCVQIQGQALYQSWQYTHPSKRTEQVKPVRYAEVVIWKSSAHASPTAENIILSKHTDLNGRFVFSVPKNLVKFNIRVCARGHNKSISASVLTQPENQKPYCVSKSFSAVPQTPLELVAQKTPSINFVAPAFFIFDKVLEANLFLHSHLCQEECFFDKVPWQHRPRIFWQAGFNPARYIDPNFNAVTSFFVADTKNRHRIFISGGKQGEVSHDTDHWDASVIVHEYAHYLMKVFSILESPGGAHNGGHIDPRMAWSEGWANFFQAAALNVSHYVDTYAIDTNSQPMAHFVPLNTHRCMHQQFCYDQLQEDEAIFREFAVSRFFLQLFKKSNTNWWQIMQHDLLEHAGHFIDLGLFQKIQLSKQGFSAEQKSAWIQKGVPLNRKSFATKLHAGENSCAAFRMGHKDAIAQLPSLHNMLHAHDFWLYTPLLETSALEASATCNTGHTRVQLKLERRQGAGHLDLHVYTAGILPQSLNTASSGNSLHQALRNPEHAGWHSNTQCMSEEGQKSLSLCLPINKASLIIVQRPHNQSSCHDHAGPHTLYKLYANDKLLCN